MNSLKNCLNDIANGTCSLQGHCSAAESIIKARKAFSKTHEIDHGTGLPKNEIDNPDHKTILHFANAIVMDYEKTRCFCPMKSECKTCKAISELETEMFGCGCIIV